MELQFVEESALDTWRYQGIARVKEARVGEDTHAKRQLPDQNEILVEDVCFEVPRNQDV